MGFVVGVIYALVADKIGRRYPVTVGFSFLNATLWILGGLYYRKGTGKAASIVLVMITCAWNAADGVVTNNYYLMASELPSALLRSKQPKIEERSG